MRHISILGSTGSIGQQTLEVVRAHPQSLSVFGLSVGKKLSVFLDQLLEFKPSLACLQFEAHYKETQAFIQTHKLPTRIVVGEQGLIELATADKNQLLVVAIVGTAALKPTYFALQKGTNVALACKEVLVAAGKLMMATAAKSGSAILPIDSEHAALKQCLAGVQESSKPIEKLILTASGGPFRTHPPLLSSVQVEDALKHPKWSMGPKITIDSATLMNKGLEVIEAHHLFGIPFEKLDVVVHPQSIVHSLVEFVDGTLLAQLALPDMRLPIQYALSYPEKWTIPWPRLNLIEMGALEFFKPDTQRFPLLNLAYEAGKKGGLYPVVLNAANEAAVHLFLERRIGFNDIIRHVTHALETTPNTPNPSFETIIELDIQVKESVLHHAA